MSQYLQKKDFENIFPLLERIKTDDLISTASYNETELLQKINTFDEDSILRLAKCSLQIAIVGAGGHSYGQIKHNEEILEITDIFDELDIKYGNDINSKYLPSQLTSRRLVRIFRYLTQKYIKEKEIASYLWRKYSDHDKNYMNNCFPGAEHLITKKEEANYLISVYKKLDTDQGTNFVERLYKTFDARLINY
jgi:hypothetical protein